MLVFRGVVFPQDQNVRIVENEAPNSHLLSAQCFGGVFSWSDTIHFQGQKLAVSFREGNQLFG